MPNPRKLFDRMVEVSEQDKLAVSFKNYCTCGGYAWPMNGRREAQPHMGWCPQFEEYAVWYAKRQAPAPKEE